MQLFFLWLLSIPFLYLNYKIIISDIKYKIIPNKYLIFLLYLIPLFYIYNFLYYDINYILFFLQLFFTIFISFILYYYSIWSAWDAKYLLVLALFIPQKWILLFVWNIALLTIFYLFLYFIYFYFWKPIFNWKYFKSLFWNIKTDLKDKLYTFLKHWDWNFYRKTIFFKILKWFIFFLIIFVSLRLIRLFLLSEIFKWLHSSRSEFFQDLLIKYNLYFILLFFILFIWLIYLIIFKINKIKLFLKNKY